MGRRLTLKTHEMGDVELYLIYQYGETWEDEWIPIQGDPLTTLLTIITQENWDNALKGWTAPLTKSLGLPPEGALRKLPTSLCYRRKLCPFYQKKICVPLHPKMPWCFEPESIAEVNARCLGSELIKLWREGVYILVVTHAVK